MATAGGLVDKAAQGVEDDRQLGTQRDHFEQSLFPGSQARVIGVKESVVDLDCASPGGASIRPWSWVGLRRAVVISREAYLHCADRQRPTVVPSHRVATTTHVRHHICLRG